MEMDFNMKCACTRNFSPTHSYNDYVHETSHATHFNYQSVRNCLMINLTNTEKQVKELYTVKRYCVQ